MKNVLPIEPDLEKIKKAAEEYVLYNLKNFPIPEEEKKFLIALCARLGLDPFKGEIHFIPYPDTKYDERTKRKVPTGKYHVRLIVSYLVYIRRALATGKLAGWKVEIIRENKENKEKKENKENKESQVKAVCTIYRKDFQHPFVWEVYLDEVKRDTPVWREQPLFMLRKVAIAQAFRLAFPEATGELPYTEEEITGLKQNGIVEAQVVEEEQVVEKDLDSTTAEHSKEKTTVQESPQESQESSREPAQPADSKPTGEIRSLF